MSRRSGTSGHRGSTSRASTAAVRQAVPISSTATTARSSSPEPAAPTCRATVRASPWSARRATTWHYQWIVLHDFLPRVIGAPLVGELIERGPRYFTPDGEPFIPFEF